MGRWTRVPLPSAIIIPFVCGVIASRVDGFIPSIIPPLDETCSSRLFRDSPVFQHRQQQVRGWPANSGQSQCYGVGDRNPSRGIATALCASRKNRGSFSWDEDVLERRVKDLLTQRAVETAQYYWSETGGEIYGEWLDKFAARLEVGNDVISTLGWGRYLLSMMNAEPVEVVMVRTAMKNSAEVVAAQEKNNARPPTLHPWRHTMNQLSADWDKEEEEEMKVALDHPPQLEAVKKEVVMQPVDIAKRVMAIREHLAKEWLEDLANVETENEEIKRFDSDRQQAGYEEAERGRRLTYDHGESFGGDSSPFRAENYEALLNYVTETGTLAAQEKMRVDGDEMGWQWIEQFLYWTKANSKTGSVGADAAGDPPRSPTASRASGRGIGGEGASARGKEVSATFGSAAGGGLDETEEDKKMRGNRLLEEMIMSPKMQMIDVKTGEPVGVDPAKLCGLVMSARLGVAERIRTVLGSISTDHGLVLRRYLEGRWQASPDEEDEQEAEAEGAGDR